MTNLEKLTAGELAAENNGTLEQLREVVGYCFPMSTSPRPTGGGFLYSKFGDLDWMFYSHTPNLPTIPITQLWEELQALKKPEIILPEKWGGEIEGLPAPILKRMMECQIEQGNKADYMVFEKDFAEERELGGFDWSETNEGMSFWIGVLEYKNCQKFFEMYPKPEKVEKSLEDKPLHEKLNELSELVDLRNKAIARHKVIFAEIEQIETKISALLK